jgi:hypothetical protein
MADWLRFTCFGHHCNIRYQPFSSWKSNMVNLPGYDLFADLMLRVPDGILENNAAVAYGYWVDCV